MKKRNVVTSPRLRELKKKRKRAIIAKILIIVIGAGAIVTLLSLVSRISKLNIASIEATGNNIIDTEAIRHVAEKEMEGNYLWIFPKTNIFFYPKSKIKHEIANTFKRLINVGLSVNSGRVLQISAGERIPKYTWCGFAPTDMEAEKACYFMDDTGYIFDIAPYFSGEVYFKFYGTPTPENDKQSDEPGEAGDPTGSYFFRDYFDKLLAFKNTLSTMGMDPAAYYVNDSADARVLLSPAPGSSAMPEIIFKTDADTEKVAENLHASLTTEPLQTDFVKKYSSLLYIDLRYGNKVFYKFK